MSKFFKFTTRPDAEIKDVIIRLDCVREAYVTVRKTCRKVTEKQELKIPFLARLITGRRHAETVDVVTEVWGTMYAVGVSDRLTCTPGNTVEIAETGSEPVAKELLAELRDALEAS